MTLTTVYVAMHGLVKLSDGINYRHERVTLASDPAVAQYPDAFRKLGTVNDDGAAYIVMLGDAAVLSRVEHLITPFGVKPAEASPTSPTWSPPGIPDFAGAYRECVAALVTAHAPLTWESVASWLQETYDPPRRRRRGSDEYADLHAKTVAGWAERAGLPHPRRL